MVGFVRGGLSLVNILASTFFGAISGSSMADTADRIGADPGDGKEGLSARLRHCRDRQLINVLLLALGR